MKTFRKTFILVAIAGITTFFGCAKDGKDGLPGPTGATGATGTTGNANVKTYTFNVPLSSFTLNSTNNSYQASTLSYAPVSMQIGQYDDVSLYLYDTDGWYALPYTKYFNTGTTFNTHYYELTDWQSLWVYIRNSAGGQPYSSMTTGNLTYRAVIIGGAAGRKAHRPDNVDFSNYNEVKAAFNLKD